MRELGLASIYLAFFAILFAAIWNARAVVRLLRVKKDNKGRAIAEVPNLRPARLAMIFTSVCLFTAGAALMHCFWNHRFDIEYVHNSSDIKLAKPFLIASFWNGQEGTFMLWCFYLSLWGLLVLGLRTVLATLFPLPEHKGPNPKPRTLDVTTLPLREPFVTAVHNWCLVGMMLLLLVRSPFHYVGPQQKWEALMDLVKMGGSAHMDALPKDPKAFFARHGIEIEKSPDGMPAPKFVETKGQEIGRLAGFTGKPEPIIRPHDGRGLNELLQNPWMCIHPPIMFIGYSALALPFMFAMAGLIKRDYQGWIHEAFPFLMFPWAFLGVGLTLGGAWAYGVLGWHGYWAWDPVENASLFPFLTATALIHGMVIQRRKGGGRGGNDKGGNDKGGNGKGASGGNTGEASRGDGNSGGVEVGTFGRANFSLAILAHLLVLYGTFLTRSGILGDASVHSFTSEGNELFWTLVVVGGLTVMVSYGIAPLIPMLGILFLITQNGFATKSDKGEIPAGAVGELTMQTGLAIIAGLIIAVVAWSVLCRLVTGKGLTRRLLAFGLLGDRWNSIQSRASYEDTASRDFLVFIGVIALVASAACVTLGTSSPIVMTLLHWNPSKIKVIAEGVVQKQFYDVAHVPIGITMLLAMALWRYFPWNGGGSGRLLRDLPRHLFLALLLTTALRAYLMWSRAQTKAQLLGSNTQWVIIACAFFTLVANFDLFATRLRPRTRMSKATARGLIGLLIGVAIGALGGGVISLGFGMDYSAMYAGIAVAGMIGLTLGVISGLETWRSGPFVAHMGVAVLFVGVIISSAYEKTEMLSLPKGKTVNIFGGDYQAQLVGDTVNPRPGDERYLWVRDHLVIEYWMNHGQPRRVRRAYPIVSLNNDSQMINVPFIQKQALVDWYWAANMTKDPAHAVIEGERLLDTISKVKDDKDDRPIARMTKSEPVSFDPLPETTFTLTGYQFFREHASADNFPIALLLEMERAGKRTPITARLALRPTGAGFSVTPEPVAIPGTDYCLLVENQMDNKEKSRTSWQLRITGGTEWFKNEEDYGVTTSENTKEFAALPGWKFRLNDRILPEGMTEGKIEENSFIRLQMEATHQGKKYELQPGLAADRSERQIRVAVPSTSYLMALEQVRPTDRKYLVSLLRDDWKPYWVVEVTHKPLINFVWIGVGVMVLGGLMTLKHRMAGSVTTALE